MYVTSVILSSASSPLNQNEFLEITCNLLKEPYVQDTIGFGSQYLKSWYKTFKTIAKHSKRNRVINFDSQL